MQCSAVCAFQCSNWWIPFLVAILASISFIFILSPSSFRTIEDCHLTFPRCCSYHYPPYYSHSYSYSHSCSWFLVISLHCTLMYFSHFSSIIGASGTHEWLSGSPISARTRTPRRMHSVAHHCPPNNVCYHVCVSACMRVCMCMSFESLSILISSLLPLNSTSHFFLPLPFSTLFIPPFPIPFSPSASTSILLTRPITVDDFFL